VSCNDIDVSLYLADEYSQSAYPPSNEEIPRRFNRVSAQMMSYNLAIGF